IGEHKEALYPFSLVGGSLAINTYVTGVNVNKLQYSGVPISFTHEERWHFKGRAFYPSEQKGRSNRHSNPQESREGRNSANSVVAEQKWNSTIELQLYFRDFRNVEYRRKGTL